MKKNTKKKWGKKRGKSSNGLVFCSETLGNGQTKCLIKKRAGKKETILGVGFGIDYATARVAAIQDMETNQIIKSRDSATLK